MYERSQPSLEEARRLLDEVIELDPEYAPAYAQRGIVEILLSDNNYGTLPSAEAQRRSKRYIDGALELDPESPEALAGLGLYYTGEPGRTHDAIAVLKRSLSINPNQLAASLWLSSALGDTGDTRGSLDVLEELTARDPLFRPAFSNAVFVFEQYGMSDKAAALIERVRKFDPNDPALIQAEAVHLYFAGDMVEGLRKAERAVTLAPNSTTALLFYSGGLLQTHQLAKLAELRRSPIATDALDALGRRDEALELAQLFAANGELFPLFNLLNRAARHADVIAYVNERWPGLDAFEQEHDPDPVGYPVMLAIAHAYKMSGDEFNAADATERYVRGIERVREQGVENRFIKFETAAYHALIGDHDAAMATLDSLADQGMFVLLPLSNSTPEFRKLAKDPRFVSIESRILGVVNAQRAELGLGPVDPARDFWQYGAR
jgi:tetratricopeptide (TPR) repeat protein